MTICELCGEEECLCDTQDKEVCPSCQGAGEFPVGDCENGVYDTCPECEGYGVIDA